MEEKIYIPKDITSPSARRYYVNCIKLYQERNIKPNEPIHPRDRPANALFINQFYNRIHREALDIQNGRNSQISSKLIEKIKQLKN